MGLVLRFVSLRNHFAIVGNILQGTLNLLLGLFVLANRSGLAILLDLQVCTNELQLNVLISLGDQVLLLGIRLNLRSDGSKLLVLIVGRIGTTLNLVDLSNSGRFDIHVGVRDELLLHNVRLVQIVSHLAICNTLVL